MSGLLSDIYSAGDRLKRRLRGFLDDPVGTVQQQVGHVNDRARAFNELTAQAAQEPGISGPASIQLGQTLADAYNPAGIVLLHGGPGAVLKVDPNRLVQSVHSTGFHTTNKVATPYTFATRGGREGVISAFEFPDELYAKTLRLNSKPLDAYPEAEAGISKIVSQDQALREYMKGRLRSLYRAEVDSGSGLKPADLATGERVNSWLRKHYGGLLEADPRMAAAGIPGRTWQYSAERPSEMATAVFPEFFSELRPIGQVPVAPGDMMRASRDLRSLLN